MKKIYSILFVSFAIAFSGYAQDLKSKNKGFSSSNADISPNMPVGSVGNSRINTLWDIQFNYDANAACQNAGGQAGVVYFNGEFWISKWSSDTLIRVDSVGNFIEKFTISGVTGVRGLTHDGTNIYASQNSPDIAIIDPVTKTQTGTITSQSSANVRLIAYDKNANSGAGGFYVSNFSDDIDLIDMTGAVTSTIPVSQIGLTSKYSCAIDTFSTGGPYLWVFDQTSSSSQNLVQIDLATGTQTGIRRNVLIDFGTSSTNAIAGGLFISPGVIHDTIVTIGGILQGTPNRLFGYSLEDYIAPDYDLNLLSISSNTEFVTVPTFFVQNVIYEGKVTNSGANPIDSSYFTVEVLDEFGALYKTDFSQYDPINPFDTIPVSTQTLFDNTTPMGEYTLQAKIEPQTTITDNVPTNDTISTKFVISDTTFARETGTLMSSLGIGQTGGGYLGSKFTMPSKARITSVTFHVNSPTEGDSVTIYLYNFTTTPLTTVKAKTATYTFTADDANNGAWITLPILVNPYVVNAGANIVVAAREYNNNLTMSTTDENYRYNASWVRLGSAAWQRLEAFNFYRTFVMRLNLLPGGLGVEDMNTTDTNVMTAYPNPSKFGKITINKSNIASAKIYNTLGQQMVCNYKSNAENTVIETQTLPVGIYNLVVTDAEGEQHTTKISID